MPQKNTLKVKVEYFDYQGDPPWHLPECNIKTIGTGDRLGFWVSYKKIKKLIGPMKPGEKKTLILTAKEVRRKGK